MLAYRHAFHAGNHADVLKHCVLQQILLYMNQKDKPYWVIDTHAGAGMYSLESEYANTKGEYHHGVARLWDRDDLPPVLQDYLDLVTECAYLSFIQLIMICWPNILSVIVKPRYLRAMVLRRSKLYCRHQPSVG
jgi:23S rRNA A2030 N6-methylase RlmJ